MAEPQNGRHTPERYEDTTDPKNPPNSVVNPDVRRAALRVYLGPIIALFIVVGLALIYWANRGPVSDGINDAQEIGTSGQGDPIGERGTDADTPGGFDPAPRPDSTADEIARRSGNPNQPDFPGVVAGNALTNLRAMLDADTSSVLGRRVTIANATVAQVDSPAMFWIEENGERAAVSAPQGGPDVRNGQTVTVSGIVEPSGQNGVRIRASRITIE